MKNRAPQCIESRLDMEEKEMLFCKGGGCTAKLGPGVLQKVLAQIPRVNTPELLIGYENSDDAAVYRLNRELAVVQTLDFFPPVVDDPYLFGQIAAANALSDIYAMGADVKTALNIVCFPEKMDLNILGKILLGGSEKVAEAGGALAGGHSIAGSGVLYGLSVMGTIHPDRVFANNRCVAGDVLILTKPLGVGIVTAAKRVGEASEKAMEQAVRSMTALNRYASEIMRKYGAHACTDVTGFGFLGHLAEMLGNDYSAHIDMEKIPYIPESFGYAGEFFLTAAAQRNRNHVGDDVEFRDVPFEMEEILFDPQTSGGLLFSMDERKAGDALGEIRGLGLPCGIVGRILQRQNKKIIVG